MTSLFSTALTVIREHRRALLTIGLLYVVLFGVGVLTTAIVPELRPGGLGGLSGGAEATGLSAVITDAYRSGNIALAALVTLAVNLLSASLLQTTLPTLIVPFLGVAITLGRGLSWGVLFSPVGADDPGLALHYVTLVIEGAAYVLVGFAAWVHGRRFLQPRRFGLATRREGYVAGLRSTVALYLWVLALLVIGAIYEAVTVILFIA